LGIWIGSIEGEVFKSVWRRDRDSIIESLNSA
jgi:hypothetical protein